MDIPREGNEASCPWVWEAMPLHQNTQLLFGCAERQGGLMGTKRLLFTSSPGHTGWVTPDKWLNLSMQQKRRLSNLMWEVLSLGPPYP